MHFRKILVLPIFAWLFLSSCTDLLPGSKQSGFKHGVFITNEGAFGNSNGSVSHFNPDSVKVTNHLFESVNNRPLGDVVQSMGIAGDKGIIVVNNSQKVEIVDLKTFESLGALYGLEYPRFFLAVNDHKGYLTDGNFAGRVYVIDTDLLKITDTIAVGNGPEKMVLFGKKLLVANSGGWITDSTISVIDTDKDQVVDTWKTGQNPADMVLDREGKLWVLCKGKVVWGADFSIIEETPSKLVVMNPQEGKVLDSGVIGNVGDYFWPQRMGLSKRADRIYYLESDGIMFVDYEKTPGAGKLLIKSYLYGFGVDPDSDVIFGLQAPSFTGAGWMIRFNPDGSRIDSLQVGIGPNQAIFN